MNPEKSSVVQNVDGEHLKVVGGNIIHGDAHFHIHGDSSKNVNKAEKVTSAGPLDPRVEAMLTKLNLMSLKTIFIEEELTMSDLAKLSKDDLKEIGVQKMKDRNAIIEEVARMRDAKPCGVITLSATGEAARIHPAYLGRYEATGEECQGSPVYRNSDGYYLYRHSDGTWNTNNSIGDYGAYRSVDSNAECPARVSQWQYAAGPSGYNPGDIRAQCSVHT